MPTPRENDLRNARERLAHALHLSERARRRAASQEVLLRLLTDVEASALAYLTCQATRKQLDDLYTHHSLPGAPQAEMFPK